MNMKPISFFMICTLLVLGCKNQNNEKKVEEKKDSVETVSDKQKSFKPANDFVQLMLDSVPEFKDMNELINSKKSVSLCGMTADGKEIKGWPEDFANPATPCADFFGRWMDSDLMFVSIGISRPRSYDNMLEVFDSKGNNLAEMGLGGVYTAQHGTMSDNPDDMKSVDVNVGTEYKDGLFIVKSVTTESGNKGITKKEEIQKFKFNRENKKFEEIK